MVMMEAFLAGDGSIEFPDERATYRTMKRGRATFLRRYILPAVHRVCFLSCECSLRLVW
jgi:hypothetical protein